MRLQQSEKLLWRAKYGEFRSQSRLGVRHNCQANPSDFDGLHCLCINGLSGVALPLLLSLRWRILWQGKLAPVRIKDGYVELWPSNSNVLGFVQWDGLWCLGVDWDPLQQHLSWLETPDVGPHPCKWWTTNLVELRWWSLINIYGNILPVAGQLHVTVK